MKINKNIINGLGKRIRDILPSYMQLESKDLLDKKLFFYEKFMNLKYSKDIEDKFFIQNLKLEIKKKLNLNISKKELKELNEAKSEVLKKKEEMALYLEYLALINNIFEKEFEDEFIWREELLKIGEKDRVKNYIKERLKKYIESFFMVTEIEEINQTVYKLISLGEKEIGREIFVSILIFILNEHITVVYKSQYINFAKEIIKRLIESGEKKWFEAFLKKLILNFKKDLDIYKNDINIYWDMIFKLIYLNQEYFYEKEIQENIQEFLAKQDLFLKRAKEDKSNYDKKIEDKKIKNEESKEDKEINFPFLMAILFVAGQKKIVIEKIHKYLEVGSLNDDLKLIFKKFIERDIFDQFILECDNDTLKSLCEIFKELFKDLTDDFIQFQKQAFYDSDHIQKRRFETLRFFTENFIKRFINGILKKDVLEKEYIQNVIQDLISKEIEQNGLLFMPRFIISLMIDVNIELRNIIISPILLKKIINKYILYDYYEYYIYLNRIIDKLLPTKDEKIIQIAIELMDFYFSKNREDFAFEIALNLIKICENKIIKQLKEKVESVLESNKEEIYLGSSTFSLILAELFKFGEKKLIIKFKDKIFNDLELAFDFFSVLIETKDDFIIKNSKKFVDKCFDGGKEYYAGEIAIKLLKIGEKEMFEKLNKAIKICLEKGYSEDDFYDVLNLMFNFLDLLDRPAKIIDILNEKNIKEKIFSYQIISFLLKQNKDLNKLYDYLSDFRFVINNSKKINNTLPQEKRIENIEKFFNKYELEIAKLFIVDANFFKKFILDNIKKYGFKKMEDYFNKIPMNFDLEFFYHISSKIKYKQELIKLMELF